MYVFTFPGLLCSRAAIEYFLLFYTSSLQPLLSYFVPPGGGHFGLFYRQAVVPHKGHLFDLATGASF